jgi:hypothetical protein
MWKQKIVSLELKGALANGKERDYVLNLYM